AEALVTCCPNDTSPVIVQEPEEVDPERETVPAGEQEDDRETDSSPLPDRTDSEDLPAGDTVALPIPPSRIARTPTHLPVIASDGDPAPSVGVVVHVSPPHRLAHVHFQDSQLIAPVGAEVGVYDQQGDASKLIARLTVVESFSGSANVSGHPGALSRISRGDVAVSISARRSPSKIAQISATTTLEPGASTAAKRSRATVRPTRSVPAMPAEEADAGNLFRASTLTRAALPPRSSSQVQKPARRLSRALEAVKPTLERYER
ncbi:MAG: hypothetical protein AAF961_06505, partial [Planctomycetota bacterium]